MGTGMMGTYVERHGKGEKDEDEEELEEVRGIMRKASHPISSAASIRTRKPERILYEQLT